MYSKTRITGFILLVALTAGSGKPAVSAVTAAPAAAGTVPAAQFITIPEDANAWRREPFKNPEEPKRMTGPPAKQASTGTSSELALRGILQSGRHFYAVINGRTVRTGDQIEGWTIAEISRYRVTVRRQNEKQIYDIYQGRIDRGTR